MKKIKVTKILDARRPAGYGSADAPPRSLVGKTVTITRDMVNWHGHICERKGEKYWFSHEELYPNECNCRDCKEVRDVMEDRARGKK